MDSFLKLVATDLYERTNGDFSRTVVVFPNKRAKLFFNEHLFSQAKAPVWSPTYLSIRELLLSMSDKEIGEPIKLICELYKSYKKECGENESLDGFYHWGEMLLSDFNDVDKSLVCAEKLFSNVGDLKKMEDFSFLTKEQREALEKFYQIFSKKETTPLKENFSAVWNKLYNIYQDYRAQLESQGLAYEGMLYREVIENLDVKKLSYDRYVFVGFNVLTKIEHKLFSELQKEGKAIFYWDYDVSYIDKINHEASIFLKKNIEDFPSPLQKEKFDCFSKPKKIQFIEASTEDSQARYLTKWLNENLTTLERDTAVVLCNEALLMPVLHSIPDKVNKVNVTMGYPLIYTPAYSFLNAIIEAHTEGYIEKRQAFRLSRIEGLLKHPFMHRISPKAVEVEVKLIKNNDIYPTPDKLSKDENLRAIFTPTIDILELCKLMARTLDIVAQTYKDVSLEEENNPMLPIYKESIFKAYTIVNRFCLLLEEGELSSIKMSTFCSLLKRAMSQEKIPFNGEPAEGVQIMGTIETRNLDFSHLIMLSVNEGFMPKVTNDVTVIPYNIRKAFDMVTMEHKICINAYYFYRLLQRAQTVTLVYNAVTDGKQKGEWSRFMLQLLVDSPHKIERYQLETKHKPQEIEPIEVQKTPKIMKVLRERFDISVNKESLLSPSALGAYIDCSLRFYFKYVAKLAPEDEVDEEVDNAMFGTLFHKTAELIYSDLTKNGNSQITKQMLLPFKEDDEKIKSYVDKAFKDDFFHVPGEANVNYNGQQLISKEIIAKFIHMLLEIDCKNTPFEFIEAEKKVFEEFEITTKEGNFKINIGGIIDRIDSLENGMIRIVDYKTGGTPKTFSQISDLFEEKKDRAKYIFQIFLYSSIMRGKCPDKKIQPLILYIHHALGPNYKELIQRKIEKEYIDIEEFGKDLEQDFREQLKSLLNDKIFNCDEPFKQTDKEDNCKYCDFKTLCHKSWEE